MMWILKHKRIEWKEEIVVNLKDGANSRLLGPVPLEIIQHKFLDADNGPEIITCVTLRMTPVEKFHKILTKDEIQAIRFLRWI